MEPRDVDKGKGATVRAGRPMVVTADEISDPQSSISGLRSRTAHAAGQHAQDDLRLRRDR